jgi:hypothetical protein
MAQTIEIPNAGQLVPGDIVRFDYELKTDNETVQGQIVKSVKDTIWADDRLDYQGSKVSVVGSLEKQRDVRLLSIYAQIRRTRREDRNKAIAIVPMSSLEAYGRSAVVVWWQHCDFLRVQQENAWEAAKAAAGKAPAVALVAAAVIGYWLLLGRPVPRFD